MDSIAVTAEFNPFHTGHAYLLRTLRQRAGDQKAIVVIMSGSFVRKRYRQLRLRPLSIGMMPYRLPDVTAKTRHMARALRKNCIGKIRISQQR